MRNFIKKTLFAATVAMCGPVIGSTALAADNYPEKPITVIVPASPGGPTEVIGRQVATAMAQDLGQPLTLMIRPGASGTIGASEAARANADGYTLLMNASWQVIYPGVFKDLRFDPMNDFELIGVMGTVPMVAMVPSASPHQTFEELVEYARENPGYLNYGHPGHAALPYLVGQLVNQEGDIEIADITYQGTGPALTDLGGEHLDLIYAPLAPAIPLLNSGHIRPLAVTPATRLDELPDVPTIAESGFPGFDVVTWYGIWVPKGTPEAIKTKLNESMVRSVKTPSVMNILKAQGTVPSYLTADEAQAFGWEEHKKWLSVLEAAGIEPK